MTNYAYLRVSTDAQDVNNQKHGLLEYCNRQGLTNITFVSDSISSSKRWNERQLGALISRLQAGDNLVFSEVSRMARSALQVLEILAECVSKEINVYIAKQQMILDDSMQARITATVLGLAAEIDREFLSQRTKEALAAKKAKGIKLGRPLGEAKSHKLDPSRKDIERYLASYLSISEIAKLIGKPRSTVGRYISKHNLRG